MTEHVYTPLERALEREVEDLETEVKILSNALIKCEQYWKPIESFPDDGKSHLVRRGDFVVYVYRGKNFDERPFYSVAALEGGNYIRVTGATQWLDVEGSLE